MSAPTFFATLETPIGELVLTAHDAGLSAVYFEWPDRALAVGWRRDGGRAGAASAALAAAGAQLAAYFDGSLMTFDLVLAAAGTTFQKRVWDALGEIEFGETTSYGQLARRIRAPRAARAVGAANGRNPLPIIVPCHRVIGADGTLTGFGGGMDRKRWLLDHERAVLAGRGLGSSEQLVPIGGDRLAPNSSVARTA
jgi:methylated-DNA-[protein]-cysteine S-methyltransferase